MLKALVPKFKVTIIGHMSFSPTNGVHTKLIKAEVNLI